MSPSALRRRPPPFLSFDNVMRDKGCVLRYMEAGNISLIRYMALQLELELEPESATMGDWRGGRKDGTEVG